jgi:amidohydrolase
MIQHLEDKGIEAIYGNHLTSFMDSGTVSVEAGPRMAGAALIEFSVSGRGGHGARPDLSVNPIFAAANVLTGITNAWANQIHVTKTVTLGLTTIQGGTALNVIPDKVDIGGTLRFFDVKEGRKASAIIKNVAENTARAHQCKVEFKEGYGVAGTPVINDDQLAELAENGVKEVLPGSVVRDVNWFASESFSRYAEISPILFAFIGARNEAYGSGAEHHNEKFDIDENALINGVLTTTKFAVAFLTK